MFYHTANLKQKLKTVAPYLKHLKKEEACPLVASSVMDVANLSSVRVSVCVKRCSTQTNSSSSSSSSRPDQTRKTLQQGAPPSGRLHRLLAGKVVFKRCKQVPDDWDTPRASQQLLSGATAHVGHVGVVDWEAKDPAGEEPAQPSEPGLQLTRT